MYHSLIFFRPEDIDNINTDIRTLNAYTKHTYNDWFLIPTSRPSVAPPEVKTSYIDVPGMNGSMDFTTALLGYPLYNNRSGSWEFMIENDNRPWFELYSEIMEWLNGTHLYVVLEDDMGWYYDGRFTVTSLDSGDKYTTITINYNLKPYKKALYSNVNGWLWDYFDFENGIIPDDIFTATETVDNNIFTDYYIETRTPEQWEYMIGSEPIIPEIIVSDTENGEGLDLKFQNFSLGKAEYTVHLDEGTTKDPKIMFGGKCLEQYYKPHLNGSYVLKGDINADGKIDNADYEELLSLMDSEEFTTYQFEAADVTNNNSVNYVDKNDLFELTLRKDKHKALRAEDGSNSNTTVRIRIKGSGKIGFRFKPGRM